MKISITDFKNRIEKLKIARSLSGRASYSNITIEADRIRVIRNNTNKPCTFSLNGLFTAYQKLDVINTVNIRQFITNRTYSPACAVLIAIGLYNSDGVRL